VRGNFVIKQKQRALTSSSEKGVSVIELVVVIAVMAIVGAVAVPQAITARRLIRFNGVTREISAQLRLTRQLAMSQRQVFRFRYDNVNKQIQIIDNQERGTIANPLMNNPGDDVIYKTIPLGGMSIPAGDISYGTPPGAPTNLSDGTTLTPLVAGQVEIIFQDDGSVVDANGNPTSAAIFFYDSQMPHDSATAISVIGAGGRVKNWRYSEDADLYVK
jgi:type II secretory pathway pseudopilin PulG